MDLQDIADLIGYAKDHLDFAQHTLPNEPREVISRLKQARQRIKQIIRTIENDRLATIRAEVHSDDRVHEVKFDAMKWFEQASDQEILDLANEAGWGGDREADAVALHLEDENEEIEALMEYVRAQDAGGFECHVNVEDAMRWLKANKPQVFSQLEEEYGTIKDDTGE
jgi:hypothetical protein